MIEIQCTSCHTRYRIDERVLPDETPTFKCSRCGHVFNADAVGAKVRKPAAPIDETEAEEPIAPPQRQRASALKPRVEASVASEPQDRPMGNAESRAEEPPVQKSAQSSVEESKLDAAPFQNVSNEESSKEHPLDRSFGDREQKPDTGENLKFDFSRENQGLDASGDEHEIPIGGHDDHRWEVGEPEDELHAGFKNRAQTIGIEPESFRHPRFANREAVRSGDFHIGDNDEEAAGVATPGKTHASGFFFLLYFLVAVGFVGASALICGEPVAGARILSTVPRLGEYFARPIMPAMIVTIHDVKAEYRTLKGGQTALVVTGSAQNAGSRRLRLVQIGVAILGEGERPLARQEVYCGNELSAKMIGEMTPREIEFSQGLNPRDSFAMEPSASAPFLMVFINPPRPVDQLRISVSKAVASESPEPNAPPAPHA